MGWEVKIDMSGQSNDCLRVCNVKMKFFYQDGNGAHFQEFTEFFMNKITKKKRRTTSGRHISSTNRSLETALMRFRGVSEREVMKQLLVMKNKTCELDCIETKIIKDNINEFIKPLTDIVNLSLRDGNFSDSWKLAVLRLLIKDQTGARINKNYRPVSNLQFVSK